MDEKEPKPTPIPVEVTFVPNDGKPLSLPPLLTRPREKSEVQNELIAALLENDDDDGEAARQHLAAGRPITFCDERFPDKIIRKWPDGRHEFVDVDLTTGTVIVLGDVPPAYL
jgi:hypothetical protein